MPIQFRAIGQLTAAETAAARKYAVDAIGFHAFCQGIRFVDLGLSPDPLSVLPFIRDLTTAVQKFELTAPATVYCGVGWGLPVFGSLQSPQASQLIGLEYQYRGFISTSANRDTAIRFLCGGVKVSTDRPTLVTFMLPAGFKGFPMQTLGADSTHEDEFLLGRDLSFRIIGATARVLTHFCRGTDQRQVLELLLEP